MTLPSLPAQGSTAWYPWATAVQSSVNASVTTLQVSDPTTIAAAITAAVTALPASGGEIIIPTGAYTAASTISIGKDNVTLTFQPGATIKPTDAATGTLASAGRIFDVSGRTNVTIRGATLLAPASATAYTLSDSEPGAVHLSNAVGCTVRGCTFTSPVGGSAIFVTGASATDNTIADNTVTGAGIVYANNGAVGTRCEGNTIRNSPADALNGIGNNSGQYSERCIVARNKIYNAGRIGIEDWGTIRGTQILHNEIYVTGANPTYVTANETFGISAVGRGTLIMGNTVIDSPGLAIETSGSGTRIIGNRLRQFATSLIGTGNGIIVNSGPGVTGPRGATITGNEIADFAKGIRLWNDFGAATISGNVLENYSQSGIECDTNDAQSNFVAADNVLRLSKPVLASGYVRLGISTYSSGGTGARAVVVAGNQIFYDPAAATGNVGYEVAIKPVTNNVLIQGNLVHAAGITPGGFAPNISTGGATPSGVRMLNNTLLGGAIIDTTGMVSPVSTNNITTT